MTPGATSTARGTNTPIPSPTSTPVTYTIVEGDMLLNIAFRYGVSLEEILAVNPEIDPNFLTIGTTIVLPVAAQDSSIIPEPTPYPLQITPPICLPDASQGAWCYAWVRNSTGNPVENVSIRITMKSNSTNNELSLVALTPVDLLPSGTELPAFGYFPLFPSPAQTEAELISALPANVDLDRFIEHETTVQAVQYTPDRRSAQITVTVTVPAGQPEGNGLKIVAIALDQQGQIAGFKQYQLDDRYPSGQTFSFDLYVYSLTGEISNVRIFSEMKP
ncbi:MAG: LysM peptidoglycan-binding domain-containing protein [Anaerolineales bacterium]|nr:LysM peptidoglycan-binding domain-containing protein [Anaerolineales bacterium]